MGLTREHLPLTMVIGARIPASNNRYGSDFHLANQNESIEIGSSQRLRPRLRDLILI